MSPEYVLPMSSEKSVTYVPGWFVTRLLSVFLCEDGNHEMTNPVAMAYTKATRMMEAIPD